MERFMTGEDTIRREESNNTGDEKMIEDRIEMTEIELDRRYMKRRGRCWT